MTMNFVGLPKLSKPKLKNVQVTNTASINLRPGQRFTVFLEEVPSENALYPTNFKTGIRFLSKKGSEFKKRAAVSFFEAKLPRFPMKPLVVETVAYWRDRRKADSGNYFKAIVDAIKSAGYIEDDWIVLPRAMAYRYPDDPRRDLSKYPRGKQGFQVTIYLEEEA